MENSLLFFARETTAVLTKLGKDVREGINAKGRLLAASTPKGSTCILLCFKRGVAVALIVIMLLNITACGDGLSGHGKIPKKYAGTWYPSAVVVEAPGAEKTVQTILQSEEELTIYTDGTYQLKTAEYTAQGEVEYIVSREMLMLYADPNTIGDWHDFEEEYEYPYFLVKMDGEHLFWYPNADRNPYTYGYYEYTFTNRYYELSKSSVQAKKLHSGVYPCTNEQDLWDSFNPLKEDQMYYDTVVGQVASIPWYDSFIKRYKDHFRIWWDQNIYGGIYLSIEDAVGVREIYGFRVASYGYPKRTVEVYDVYDNYWYKENYDEIVSNEESDSAPGEMPDNNETPYNEEVIGYAEVLIDVLYIRSIPSTEGNKPKRFAEQGQVYEVVDIVYDDIFTWYKIGDEEWFADDNGEWVVFTPVSSY